MNTQEPNKLKTADQTAKQHSGHQAAGDGVLDCPLQQKQSIEVQVVGMDDKPLLGIAVELRNNDDNVLRGKTDQYGLVRFTGLEEASYRMSLWELDEEAWEPIEEKKFTGDAANSQGVAAWLTLPPGQDSKGFKHTIVQGECIAKIADKYGFFPDTIWSLAENAKLREQRKDMYVLAPDDQVFIPVKRINSISVTPGTQVKIRHNGVPEILRIRFLKHDDTPRKGIAYLLSVKTVAEGVLPDLKGTTDDKGFVDEPIPPSAVFAKIVLGKQKRQEVHEFDLGYVDPIDTVAGVQSRLNSLGYLCGKEDGELGQRTRAGIKAFQNEKEIEQTGEMDDRTQKALMDMMRLS